MVPFMYGLKELVKTLLGLVVLTKCKSGVRLKEIDFSNKANMFKLQNINLGFAAEKKLSKLTRLDTVTQVNDFRKGAKDFVVSLLIKWFYDIQIYLAPYYFLS